MLEPEQTETRLVKKSADNSDASDGSRSEDPEWPADLEANSETGEEENTLTAEDDTVPAAPMQLPSNPKINVDLPEGELRETIKDRLSELSREDIADLPSDLQDMAEELKVRPRPSLRRPSGGGKYPH